MMNILHLRASNFYGGPERQLHFHARLSQKEGYHTTVASFAEAGKQPEFLDNISADDIPTVGFDVSSAYDTAAVAKLRAYLREHQIDIICTHDYRSHMLGCLARTKNQRWLAFSRGFTQDNMKVRLYHWVEKITIRFANHIVAVSQGQKNKLIRLLVPEYKITVAHNAIDLASFSSVEAVDLRQRFGFPPDSLIVISAGRFSREKGQSDLVKAASLAIAANDKLRFVLFGDGPDLEDIRYLIRYQKLEKLVMAPGFDRRMTGCIKGADIVVNPSLSEGLPNVLLESMALGVPVIATAVGGVPELVQSGVDGLTVPPADPQALADAVLKLAASSALRDELAAAAREKVADSFSFEKQLRILTSIYDRLAPQGKA